MLHTRPLHIPPCNTEALFVGLFGRSTHAFWLDSARLMPGYSRFSYMGDAQGPASRTWEYDVGDGSDFFATLAEDWRARRAHAAAWPCPFQLGYVGYFGYEMKALCDGSAEHAAPTPDAALLCVDRAVAVDHATGQVHGLALGSPEAAEAWFGHIEAQACALSLLPPPPAMPALALRARHTRAEYLQRIAACQAHILAGDAYELCLTNQFTAPCALPPLDMYRALRAHNPAPYGAYLRVGDVHVLSSSPERFLAVSAEGQVESKPIKGTRPRGTTPEADAALCADLLASAKDRAENLMIVDLLRNDLSRVCDAGSVDVSALCAVETYATVHQLVSTIRGQLAPGATALDALRAAFPGGSMTGAPKHRAMQILDALEAGPRGIYSGALGWLSLDGAADFSIVIRTLVCEAGKVSIGAGGAITADSNPEAEWEEMIVKLRALGVQPPAE